MRMRDNKVSEYEICQAKAVEGVHHVYQYSKWIRRETVLSVGTFASNNVICRDRARDKAREKK